jgi:hypothetical protein
MATTAHQGYANIMRNVEALVRDHSALVPFPTYVFQITDR